MRCKDLTLFSLFLLCCGCGELTISNNSQQPQKDINIQFDTGVGGRDASILPKKDMPSGSTKDTSDKTDLPKVAEDMGVVVPQEKWDACKPEAYNEKLVIPDVSVDDLIANYNPADYQQFVIDALKRRMPYGAWIVEEVMRTQNFDCVAEYASQYANMGPLVMLENTPTIVHECAHGINMETYNGVTHDYYVRPDDAVYQVNILDGPDRSVIKNYLPWQDSYSELYLDLAGNQKFDMVLEEVDGYIHDLISGVAFVDVAYEGKQLSLRDGTATFLLYMAIYLHHTRLNDNAVYLNIVNDKAWRLVILTMWDKGKLALKMAAPYPEIGIDDVKILAELDKYNDEISLVRALECP